MSACLRNRWFVTCGVIWFVSGLAGFGCMGSARQVSSSEAEPSAAAALNEPERAFDENRDLCLFGRGNPTPGIVFEGRAAVDLRQHTTATEGADFDPDVDPAGKRLVFASTRHARHSHLYIKSIYGATVTQITDEPANDAQPVFCPKGERIAFVSDRSGQWDVWVVDVNGRNPTQVTHNPAAELHPSWSPDGKRLAYCRVNSRDNLGELWVVELANPGIKRLIGEGLFPEWSPDGHKIAYQRSRARGDRWFSIWTLDVSNDEVLYPTEIASRHDAALISPVWSPDGTQIAFSTVMPKVQGSEPRINGGGRSDIGIVDADGRGLQYLTDGRGDNYSPAWSVDGRIYFTAKLERSETIWSVRPFRPPLMVEPTIKTGDRRAAAVTETDFAD